MPGFNRQGPPNGQGNQSGRRMGKCNPENRNNPSINTEAPKGMGRGMGNHAGQGQGRGIGRKLGHGNHS